MHTCTRVLWVKSGVLNVNQKEPPRDNWTCFRSTELHKKKKHTQSLSLSKAHLETSWKWNINIVNKTNTNLWQFITHYDSRRLRHIQTRQNPKDHFPEMRQQFLAQAPLTHAMNDSKHVYTWGRHQLFLSMREISNVWASNYVCS